MLLEMAMVILRNDESDACDHPKVTRNGGRCSNGKPPELLETSNVLFLEGKQQN